MLLLTGVMTVTTSYAWFTANKTVTVNTINVNVAASSGLQISVDGVEWKPVITNDDILNTINGTNENYPTNKNQFPQGLNSLAPVSTDGTVDIEGLMEMYLGEIGSDDGGNYALTATKDNEVQGTTGNFIAFDLFFQVQKDSTVYLTNLSSIKAGPEQQTGIQNAARAGFIVSSETANAGDPAGTIQALKGTTARIWEPNYDVHTKAGIANASSVYGKTVNATGNDRLDYYGVTAEITEGVALDSTDATYFTAVTPDITSVASGIPAATYAKAFDLKAGVSKVRVYLWVEGQDVDCENVASGGSIAFDMQFSLNENVDGG